MKRYIDIYDIINKRKYYRDQELAIIDYFERSDNVLFILTQNEQENSHIIFRYENDLDVWSTCDYNWTHLKSDFDDSHDSGEELKNNLLEELSHVHDEIFSRLRKLEKRVLEIIEQIERKS